MKKKIIIIIAIILLAVIGIGAYLVLTSPEFALLMIAKDVKENGIEVLEAHLTDEALESIKPLAALVGSDFGQSLISKVPDEDVGAIATELSQINWSLGDIMKSSERAVFGVGFDYRSEIIGTVDLVLEKLEREWKIASLDNLDFTKLDLGFGDMADFELSDLFG